MINRAKQVVLSCQNLYKSYSRERGKKTMVLSGVNLDVLEGDFVTILGQSGSGKSTLLKLLGGFTSPSSGHVLFHEQPVKGINPKIGMVFQENNLYPWLTVEQNIRFGFKVRGYKPSRYVNKVNEVIEHVGLTYARKLYPHQLSGGMKQRVAIARSIAVAPDVLLLDEPFSALDIQLRRRLQEFLLSIWEETSTTMVLVTHNVEEAILLGQKLIVVGGHPGRIIETVDISALSYRDRYHPLFLELQRSLEAVIEQDALTKEAERKMEGSTSLVGSGNSAKGI